MPGLRQLQRDVYQNKLDKGFNVTDVCKEFCYAFGELSEAFDAYNKRKDDLGEEKTLDTEGMAHHEHF